MLTYLSSYNPLKLHITLYIEFIYNNNSDNNFVEFKLIF